MIRVDTLEENIEHPLAHQSAASCGEEVEFNYRLDLCDTVLYFIENNVVIGHLGISEDTVRCLFVDEEARGKGISYKLYKRAFEEFGELYSDDAREASDQHIWEKLSKEYPNNIQYLSKRDQFFFSN